MNDVNFEDLMDMVISDAIDMPFIEFYKTVFAEHKKQLENDRNIAWMIWMMSRKINGNEIKARKLLSESVKARAKNREIKAEIKKEEFDRMFSQRIEAMKNNGEILTKKLRDKYKAIIQMLCVGSTYDFESAMRTQFPNFGKTDNNKYVQGIK